VTTTRGTKLFNRSPDYQNTHITGRNCGITCRSATVTVTLP